MNTESIFTVIQHIDNQISDVELNESNRSAVQHLLELRNKFMVVYKPDPKIDWTIKNKKALKAIKFFDWKIKWIK